jgi:hypothetical protein
MTTEYKTTKTSTQRLVKALQDVIDLLPQITYVDMSEDAVIVKANKLIESLKVRDGK